MWLHRPALLPLETPHSRSIANARGLQVSISHETLNVCEQLQPLFMAGKMPPCQRTWREAALPVLTATVETLTQLVGNRLASMGKIPLHLLPLPGVAFCSDFSQLSRTWAL